MAPFRSRLQSALVARRAEHERAERALAAARDTVRDAEAKLARITADRQQSERSMATAHEQVASGDPVADGAMAMRLRLLGQRQQKLAAAERLARAEVQRRIVQRDLAARDEGLRAAAVKALADLAASELAAHRRACERRADAERLDDHLVRWQPGRGRPTDQRTA
jgi:hypothetical protein